MSDHARRVPVCGVAEANLDVALIGVGDVVLERLLQGATTDASANEVTPPLTAGTAWTPIRIAWLRDFHRGRRGGLDGSAREATSAITVERRSSVRYAYIALSSRTCWRPGCGWHAVPRVGAAVERRWQQR